MLQTNWACVSRILVPVLLVLLFAQWFLFSKEPSALLTTSTKLPDAVSRLARSFSTASEPATDAGEGPSSSMTL